MALFKDFTFDGENSKDYGVYISGDAVYDAPDRAMDMVQIPGRNGALALDNGYYNNINVTYPAGCFADDQEDFAAKLSRIRNMLASRHRYCRLEDSYHPDHFRLALYRSGLDVSPVAMNRAGRFNITFDAKPQRFLKTGEEIQALDADEPPTEVYGPAAAVTVEGKPLDAATSAVVNVAPISEGRPSASIFRNSGKVSVNDKAPYLFRPTADHKTGAGSKNQEWLVGGTVAWNQFASITKTTLFGGLTVTYDNETGWTTLNGEITSLPSASAAYRDYGTGVKGKNNHKILSIIEWAGATTNETANATYVADGYNSGMRCTFQNKKAAQIRNITQAQGQIQIVIYLGAVGDVLTNLSYRVQLYDLTQMFGSTIADAIYAMEQAEAGAGVAWFKRLFPKDYYDYDAGSLQSVKTTAHKMVGFNQWDEEWEQGGYDESGQKSSLANRIRNQNFIPCVPNSTYYVVRTASFSVYFYDANKTFIGSYGLEPNNLMTTPNNCYYMNFHTGSSSVPITTYDHDICINLHWDGERDGEYEPYEEYSYPLDDVELRGIPKLANGELYYDGDTYEADGTVTRKYAEIVFDGTQSYDSIPVVSGQCRGFFNVNGILPTTLQSTTVDDDVISSYLPSTSNDLTFNGAAGIHRRANGAAQICVSLGTNLGITTSAEFLAYLTAHPLTVFYPLATPTTESADPFTSPQIVSNWGTEEYVDTRDVPIPVGHNSTYFDGSVVTASFGRLTQAGTADIVQGKLNSTTPAGTYTFTPVELPIEDGEAVYWSDAGNLTITVQSAYELENPTLYPSRPLIHVEGSGTVQINDTIITISEHSGDIDIDCDLMDCYRGTDSMNQYVSFSGNSFPELGPGVNRILLNGPDRVEITPRWWEL